MGFLEVLGWVRTATFVVVVVAWFTVGQKRYVKVGVVLVLARGDARAAGSDVRLSLGAVVRAVPRTIAAFVM